MDDDTLTRWRADLETARTMLQNAPLDARDRARRLAQTLERANSEHPASAEVRDLRERLQRFLEASDEVVERFQASAAQRQRVHRLHELRDLHAPLPHAPAGAKRASLAAGTRRAG